MRNQMIGCLNFTLPLNMQNITQYTAQQEGESEKSRDQPERSHLRHIVQRYFCFAIA
jgi:hypothetical protein